MTRWPTDQKWPTGKAWPSGNSWPSSNAWPAAGPPPPVADPLYTFVTGATVLWAHRSSNLTESGGTVSQIDDLTGNGFHWVQPTGAIQPTYSAAGGPMSRPSISSGGTRTMTMTWDPAAPGTTPIWRLGIFRIDAYAASRVLWSGAATGAIALLLSDPVVFSRNTTLGTGVAMPVNTWLCTVELFTGAAATGKQRVGANEVTGQNFGNTNPTPPFTLFGRNGTADISTASWCEDICCDAEPSNVAAILAQVASYYGASLV